MTATTNKAAEVLEFATGRTTQTIHSFLNLTLYEDYESGKTKLNKNPRTWVVHEQKIIFIDECSMIDSQLFNIIGEGTHQCKIVYVGDRNQLAPVTEKLSPVYQQGYQMFELTEQELAAYEMPITQILESTSLKDMVEFKDREFLLLIEA